MAKLDRLVWAAQSTFHVGRTHIGVRSDSEWLDELLRRALAAHYVPDIEAPPNYSLVVPSGGNGVATALNLLYEGHTNLIRSRHPKRVVRGLINDLARQTPRQDIGLLRVQSIAMVKDGRAVLVPRNINNWMDVLAPRINRGGWQFVDQPWTDIDMETVEVVVSPPVIDVDESVLEELYQRQGRREPDPIEPGRYPLVGWGAFSAEEATMDRGPGAAVAAMTALNPMEFGPRNTVEWLLQLTDEMPITGLGSPWEGDLATRLMAVGA